MSVNVLDQAQVNFTFNNAQFESGVAQSLATLASLKAAIKNPIGHIDTSAFDDLNQSMKQLSTSGIAENVGSIADRFSTLGVIGGSVLHTLTSKAVELGLSLGKKVLSPISSIFNIIKSKGWSRATNEKQAEFMIKNLGLAWEKASVDINNAVQDTRFGFDEAAVAAAQLATSGVKFGEDMPDVLKAIGNAASMANVEFGDMAHIFTTMASNGRVYGDNLQQFSVRGLNATKALADYLGKTEAQVKDMVSDGKVSFEDFYKATNEAFGEAAFKANETFTGVLANNKAVFARIGKIYASGFMDAARDVLNATLPKLKEFEKAIKPIGLLATDIMNAIASYLIPIINRINFKPIASFIDKYVTPLREKIQAITKPIKDVKDATDKAALSAEELLEMANKVIRGDFGNGNVRRKKLEELGYSYERIQNKVNELLGCSFRYEVQEEETGDAVGKSTDKVKDQAKAVGDLNKKFSDVENIIRFINGLSSVKTLIEDAKNAIGDFVVKPLFDNLGGFVSSILQFLGDFGDGFSKVVDEIHNAGVVTKIIHGVADTAKTAFELVKGVYTYISDSIKGLLSMEEVQTVIGDVKRILLDAINYFDNFGTNIKNFFKGIADLPGVSKLLDRLGRYGEGIKKLATGAIKTLFKWISKLLNIRPKGAIDTVFGEGGIIDKAAGFIDKFLGVIEGGISIVTSFYKALFKARGNKHILAMDIDKLTGPFADAFVKLKEKCEPVVEWLGKGFDKIGDFGGKVIEFFKGLVDSAKGLAELEGIKNFIKSVTDLGKVLKESFLDVVEKVLKKFDEMFGTHLFKEGDIVNMFGDGGVIDTAANVLSKFVDSLEQAPSAVTEFFNSLSKIPEKVQGLGGITQGVMDTIADFAKEMSKGLPSFVGYIFDSLVKHISETSIDGGTLAGALNGFKEFFEQFSKLFNPGSLMSDEWETMFNIVSGWLDKLSGSLNGTKGSVGDATAKISSFNDVLEIAVEYLKKFVEFASEKTADWGLEDWTHFFKEVIKLGTFATVMRAIGKSFLNVAGSIKEFGNIFKSVQGAISEFGNIGKSFADVGTEAANFLKNWGNVDNVFKQWRKKPLTTALRDFAVAVALIAGSIWLLGSDYINYDRIRENSDILLTFAGALLMLTYSMQSPFMSPQKIEALSNAFIKMGAGIFLLTASIAIFGHMDRNVLIQGGAAVTALMIALAGAAQIAASNGKVAAAAFLAMAAAVGILVPAVYLFGKMRPETLIQGGLAVVAFMTSMAIAVGIASVSGSKGAAAAFLGIALAIGILVPSIWLLGTMKPEKVAVGGAAVIALMTAMSIAALIAGNCKGALPAFLGVAAALAVVTVCLGLLSIINPKRLLKTASSLVLIMASLTAAVWVAGKAGNPRGLTTVLAAMTACVILIGGMLFILSTLTDPNSVLKVAVGLSLVIVAITAALAIASKIDPLMAAKAGLAIDAFVVVVGALFAALGYVASKCQWALDAARGLGQLIANFLDGLHSLDKKKTDDVQESASGLSAFGEKIQGFLAMLTNVDDKAANKASLLSSAILKIASAELLGAIGDFLGLRTDFKTFGENLTSYAKAFIDFNDAITGVTLSENIDDVITYTTKLVELSSQLQASDGAIQYIIGEKNLGDFGAQLLQFAIGFNSFNNWVNLMGDIDTAKIDAICSGTTGLIALTDNLKNSGGVLQYWIGAPDLGDFGSHLTQFAMGFNSFNNWVHLMKDIDSAKIGQLTESSKKLIELSGELKNSGGFIQWIIGQEDLGAFGTSLADLAEGFKTLNDAVVDVKFVQIDSAIDILKRMASMDGAGEAVQTDLNPLLSSLIQFATSLDAWTTYTEGFDSGKFVSAVIALGWMRDFLISLSDVDFTTASSFSQAVNDLATANVQSFIQAFADSETTVTEAVSKFVAAAELGLHQEGHETAFYDAGAAAAAQYSKGYSDNQPEVSGSITTGLTSIIDLIKRYNSQYSKVGGDSTDSYSAGMQKRTAPTVSAMGKLLATVLNKIATTNSTFSSKGGESAHNYASGITKKAGEASTAASSMASNAASKLSGSYDSFKSKGEDAARGFRDGINAKAREAADAAYDMVKNALKAAQTAQDSASPSKEFAKLGMYADQGYAKGVDNGNSIVVNAINNMVEGGLASAMAGISKLASMISDEVEVDPVIRPVVDTSGVEYGIGRAQQLINTLRQSEVAATVSTDQNKALANRFEFMSRDYRDKFDELIIGNDNLIKAVKQNRYAIIDGDEAYSYLDRRLGMSY